MQRLLDTCFGLAVPWNCVHNLINSYQAYVNISIYLFIFTNIFMHIDLVYCASN